ncbi:MAG: DUF1653 domain-containing protein [Dethiobacter sp.]|nr:DUF1653 domain-containing protein [Dethiobacter sp.]
MKEGEKAVVKVGHRYKHFKGKEYIVLHLARDSETQEELVVYKAVYGEEIVWVRPLNMFLEQVVVDGKLVNRFNSE